MELSDKTYKLLQSLYNYGFRIIYFFTETVWSDYYDEDGYRDDYFDYDIEKIIIEADSRDDVYQDQIEISSGGELYNQLLEVVYYHNSDNLEVYNLKEIIENYEEKDNIKNENSIR